MNTERFISMFRQSRPMGAALACALFLLACEREPSREIAVDHTGPPNVVFVLLDTVRADRVEASRGGVPLMPNVASFSETAWNFTGAVSPSSWTKPAVTSLFTVLAPAVHQVQFGISAILYEGQEKAKIDVLPGSLPTMASYFKRNGYATKGIQTNANVLAKIGFDQGFDIYKDDQVYPELRAHQVTDWAISSFDARKDSLFLYVHYMDAHAPYGPPEGHESPFPDKPAITNDEQAKLKEYYPYYNDKVLHDLGVKAEREHDPLREEAREYIRYLYDAELHFLDGEVGRLIAHVRAADPSAIIILTSDHGEELWEHGSVGHSKTLYEEAIHVPMIISIPGTEPRRIASRVETLDLLPTLAAKLGWQAETHWQGRDLAADHGMHQERPVFSETHGSLRKANLFLEAVYLDDYKLIIDRNANQTKLFNLEEDPLEQHNLANDQPERLADLTKLIEAWRAENEAHPLRQTDLEQMDLSDEERENLSDVGYISGE